MMSVYEGLAVAPLLVTQAFVPNIVASTLKRVGVRGHGRTQVVHLY